MGGIALLKVLNDAEGVEVMVEAAAVTLEALIQCAFAGVTEGWVTDVVDESQRFGKILVQTEGRGSSAGDLRNLDGMSETTAKVVRGSTGENLGLAGEAAKGTRLNNSFPVPLKRGARGAGRSGIDARQERILRVSNDGALMQIGWHVHVRV